MTETRPWVTAIYRLLKAKQRPDPHANTRLKYWTQGDLAYVAEVRPNTLSELMHGREPSVRTLQKIGEALGVPVWTFFVTERQATLLNDQERADTVLKDDASVRSRLREIAAQEFESVLNRVVDRAVTEAPTGQSTATPANKLAVVPPESHKPTSGGKKKKSA